MAFTEQLSQQLAIPRASLVPVNRTFNNSTPFAIEEVDMMKFKRVMAWGACGVLDTANSANVAFYWQSSAENNANYANISGANTVTLTANNKECTTEIRADQLPDGHRYVRLAVLISVANALTSAVVFGGESRYRPASQYDASGITRAVHA